MEWMQYSDSNKFHIYKACIYYVNNWTFLLLLLKFIVVSLVGTVKNPTISSMSDFCHPVKNNVADKDTVNSPLLFKHTILYPLMLNIKIRC